MHCTVCDVFAVQTPAFSDTITASQTLVSCLHRQHGWNVLSRQASCVILKHRIWKLLCIYLDSLCSFIMTLMFNFQVLLSCLSVCYWWVCTFLGGMEGLYKAVVIFPLFPHSSTPHTLLIDVTVFDLVFQWMWFINTWHTVCVPDVMLLVVEPCLWDVWWCFCLLIYRRTPTLQLFTALVCVCLCVYLF